MILGAASVCEWRIYWWWLRRKKDVPKWQVGRAPKKIIIYNYNEQHFSPNKYVYFFPRINVIFQNVS